MNSGMSPMVFLIALVVTALICVPYAALAKYAMRVLFGHRVWFGLVLLTTLICVSVAALVDFLYGFGTWMSLDDAFTILGLKEIAASYLLQIALYYAFVPDAHIRWIAPWKWFAVVTLQYALSLAIIYGILYVLEPEKFAGFLASL